MVFNGLATQKYIDWMYKQLDIPQEEGKMLDRLFFHLLSKDFQYTHDSDANRASDGLALRENYISQEYGILVQPYFANDDCSILEMLVAFAKRIETDIMGEPGEDNPTRWFKLMLDTIGVTRFSGLNYDEESVETLLQDPLVLFPGGDKSLSLWEQMQNYINKNYPID